MKNRISFAIFLLLVHLSAWAQIGGDYNPNNPSDPGKPTQEYTLTLKASPSNGGSFNTTSTNIAGGKTYNLRAYPSTDFAFVAWLCNGDTLSKSSSYTYTMPYHDVEIIGVFTYSPSSPSDPNVVAQKYTLTLKATPSDGGSFNTSSAKVSVGERYNLRAYPNTDFSFAAWLCEGDTLSKSASYDYTMPAHNVEITGVFAYRPSSPSDPQEQALKYQLSLTATPINSGSFNISNERLAVGSNNSLRAYANTDFVFKHWIIGDSVLSTNPNMDFVMPSHNVQMVGVFEYNPASPANPNRNHWDKQTGEVIVDDFPPGNLSSAISSVISGNSSNDVQMIIVSGRITSNDFGIANNYQNCSLLDLSRVTGVTEVPSYAFDYTNLETIYLPATIEKIGTRAFAECTKLSAITVYAMTPPTLESGVFQGVPEGLVVYVPAAAIAQYQDDETWGKFTLLPIQEDIRSISISLPESTNAQDYAQMWLELTNTKSGQRMHYVMTDRQAYTFANIIRNTSWNVTLRNERGDVFGRIDNVEVKDEDVSVAFNSLLKPQSVVLSVLTPDGQDVTTQTQVTWTDAQGNYVAQGTSLTGLPAGYQTNYSVALSQELAMQYVTPQTVEYVLKDDGNSIVYKLEAIEQLQISGKVKNAATGLPLIGATVSASQTFGGKYSKTKNTKTDNKGVFTLTIANVPTSVAFAATNYISQTFDFSNNEFAELNEFAVPDVSLKSITGATITLGFTYKSCEGDTQDRYSDYKNVNYELFNVTKNRAVSQYNVQYPQIVLLEEIEDGDVLRLTATSRTNAFMPVTATTTIAEQKAEATFGIVELGQIRSSFTTTGNSSVVGSLYDAEGKLVKTYDYANASLTISNLADGQYTLVSMGSSRLFNTIYDLSQLPQTGLTEGTDYVLNTVEVKSGKITQISINEVPTLDESKLYYTGDNTSFTVNKPSIVAGNYLTLTGRIDFKSAYATKVSNVQMIVDMPESCEFVENSVMVGNSTSSYTLNGNRIIIPMTRYTDRVRFCIIPTLSGEYAPSAFVQFDVDDETVTQPIGSANYTAKDLSISVPSTIAKTTIPVSGTAIGKCDIEIYDNGVLIGHTTSLANGTWTASCQLFEPENLSTHNIFAKITTKQGLCLQSETIECLYDKDAVFVNKVTMINTAHTASNLELYDYVTVFDFLNPQTSIPAYWYWPSYPTFTFLIDITYHDRRLIPFVWLHVFTSDGNVRSLRADYDENKDCWIAVNNFTSEALPTRVSVTIENMVYDLSSEATYNILMDKYIGEISLSNTIKEEDGSTTYKYTDCNGRHIFSVNTSESNLTVDQLIEDFKREGYREDELLNDDSDYIPEDEDDVLNEDIKVLTESRTGSLVLVGNTDNSVAVVRVIREGVDSIKTKMVSSIITKEWKSFFKRYFDPATCSIIQEYKKYQEHLDEYVKIIYSSKYAYTVFVDYRKLPLGTKIPRKQLIAKFRRIYHSSKRYTTWSMEYSSLPSNCPLPPPPPPPTPPTPPAPAVMDPSGYVYEGVSSNRLEGVTATAYYKEMVEDMYGDLHENIIKWDASEYAQENPLFTDGFGMYAWDVPSGLWQVKFEKEGYETTYSDWLPVPPPQLDVNIAMKQNRQPVVKTARAYEDAVEVEFDKYMITELLTTENITVMQNGKAVDGSVELLNEEVSYEGESETFASKIRFNAAQPFTENEVTLMVNNRVKSYAGVRMQDNYQQAFSIEQEIKKIISDSLVVVGYGEKTSFTVSVLPASASKGKMLTVKTSSPMILSVETEQVVIGNDGKAEIIVSGELPGIAALTFTIDGIDNSAQTIAYIEQKAFMTVATPTASIASGTVVEKGTAITLTCETEGATIYYTLDGSCPCENTDARKVYDGTPIIINENVTIKAMAMAPDMYESDVAEFTYIVDVTGIDDITINELIQIYPLPVRDKVNINASGKIIKSVTILSLNGIAVTSTNKYATKVTIDVSRIPTGIYIINVTTADSTFSRKILKVE